MVSLPEPGQMLNALDAIAPHVQKAPSALWGRILRTVRVNSANAAKPAEPLVELVAVPNIEDLRTGLRKDDMKMKHGMPWVNPGVIELSPVKTDDTLSAIQDHFENRRD
jgi:hypothetical protein